MRDNLRTFSSSSVLVLMVAPFFLSEGERRNVALTFAGVLYVPVLFSFVYFAPGAGWDAVCPLWLLGGLGGDTCAYFTGRALGQHKLVPYSLRPQKTLWRASAASSGDGHRLLYGGLIHSTLADTSLYTVLATSAVIGLFGSVFGAGGEPFFIVGKTVYGRQRFFGKLIPRSRRGILDRFDSVLLTAPAVVIAINVVAHFGI